MWNNEETNLKYMLWRRTFEGWEIRTRFVEEYELVLILKGKGYIKIEGTSYQVRYGDLICFRPGILHRLWVEEEPYMEFFGMHFEIPHSKEPLSFPNLFHLEAPMRLVPLFQKLYEVYCERGYLYEWRQKIMLQQILCEIFTMLHEQEEPMGVVRVRKALEYIHENPCRKITLEDLVKKAGIQKTVFLSCFRVVTGTTPIQYIIVQRLQNARDLLVYSDLSVRQIAEECGFSDPFYFSRCYKKHFGLSPIQYRELHRN